MRTDDKAARSAARNDRTKLKNRKLGGSDLRFVEVVPREVADAEIERDFADSKLWPDS